MKQISISELKNILKDQNSNILLVDVRTPEEYTEYNIESAINVPLAKIAEDTQKFIQDNDKYENVYLYCNSGNQSSQACKVLESLGAKNFVNVSGGILDW